MRLGLCPRLLVHLLSAHSPKLTERIQLQNLPSCLASEIWIPKTEEPEAFLGWVGAQTYMWLQNWTQGQEKAVIKGLWACINRNLVPSQTQGTQGVPVVLTDAALCDFAAPLVLVPRAQPIVKLLLNLQRFFLVALPISHSLPWYKFPTIQISSVNHFSSKAKFSGVFCLFLNCYYWDFNNYCSILHPVFFIDFFLQR